MIGNFMSYAWYSEHQDKFSGHCLYKTLDNLIIKVTEITSFKETKPLSRWNDLIYLGEVNECIKVNKQSIKGIDSSIPIENQMGKLFEIANDMLYKEIACKKQFKTTQKCFCFTCPVKYVIH